MTRFLLARARQLVLVVLGLSSLVFFLVRVSGDPASVIAGIDASPEVLEAVRENLGLNDPVLVQYIRFLGDLVRFDFGTSFQYRIPAMDVVMSRLPLSGLLAGTAAVMAFLVGIPAGIIAAVRRRSFVGRFILGFAALGQSVPGFVLGILLILVFAVQLGRFPSFGWSGPVSLVLPAVTLSSFVMARQIRLAQAYTIEELNAGYVRTASSLGYSNSRIRYRHILRNVLVPMVSLLGIEFGVFVGGAVITEAVFAWPGLGTLMVGAVSARDYPIIQSGVFVIALIVVVVNFIVDLFYRVIDPRLRTAS